jgi:phosphatidylinositol alpha-1,6-mannosyltransferase
MVPDRTLLGLFPQLHPASVGGVQLSGRLAWQALADPALQQAWRPLLFCYQPAAAALSAPDHRQFAIGSDSVIAHSALQALRLALTRSWQAELVLIWHIGLLKLLPFLRLRNALVVLFLHGIEVWRYHDPLTRSLLPRVNVFLSNSDYTWQRFLQFYPQLAYANHRTVQLGVATALPALPAAVPPGPPAALILSRLMGYEDYKGHRELIAAWPLVLQAMPDAQLWIAGDGDLRPELEQLVARTGLCHSIRFFGRVSEAQKQQLLADCRCFVMPSRGEGFGLVYLEAMRMGRPCLVSDCDAGHEVINPPQAGLAVDPGDREALAAAVVRLLAGGGAWQQWSQQAHCRYKEQFTAQHFQHRLIRALSF